MAKIKTIQIIDGKWYRLGNAQFHECCFCSAVHRVDYKMERGMIFERWRLDDSETRKARRSLKK